MRVQSCLVFNLASRLDSERIRTYFCTGSGHEYSTLAVLLLYFRWLFLYADVLSLFSSELNFLVYATSRIIFKTQVNGISVLYFIERDR